MNQMIRNTQPETNVSLDNTSRAPEELVSSRYALRSGSTPSLTTSISMSPMRSA